MPSSSPVANVPGPDDDLCFASARDLAALIREGKLSARTLMEAHLRQIERINPKVNAIVTMVPEPELLAQARAADEAVSKRNSLGPLHGLPVAVKDLVDTKGIRTTYGSPLFKDHVPERDALAVERMKNAGAIVIGKTNTPEFGMGSQTFNPIFGPTRNPYDITKTCGGSTGGGAVALACGMAPIVNGTDMGGSLRNPANFCNVVGIRPSPGRVPNDSWTQLAWLPLTVSGPMARSVADCALLLGVLAGFDPRSPIAIDQSGSQFFRPLGGRSFKGVRVAMIKDLGLPWEAQVIAAITAQRKVFESLGCVVEEAEPDLTDANECFLAWRHWAIEAQLGGAVDANPADVNAYGRWHVEKGRKLTGTLSFKNRGEAERFIPAHARIHGEVRVPDPARKSSAAVQRGHAVSDRNCGREDGELHRMDEIGLLHSAAGNPAISVPCAFSESGLPIEPDRRAPQR